MNCFERLGLPRNCSEEELKKRYKQLAKKYHPDVSDSEEAHREFIEISAAYEQALKILENGAYFEPIFTESQQGPTKQSDVEPEEETQEDAWYAYRKRAQEEFKRREDEQKRYMVGWYQRLRSGFRNLHFNVVMVLALLVFIGLVADIFLPHRFQDEYMAAYSDKNYHSSKGELIAFLETRSGRGFWMNFFSNSELEPNCHFVVEETWIFHSPIQAIVSLNETVEYVPIHFTVRWIQFWFLPFLLLPLFFRFYKHNDEYFIFGNYFTRFVLGFLLFLFLLSDNHWLHLLTLGFI